LERLTAAERDELLTLLGVSKTTYYRLREQPQELTLDQADRLRKYLEQLDNCEYDMFQLLEHVDLTA